MAADLPLPRKIVAHAHWTVDKVKMSKSLCNVVDPNDAISMVCCELIVFCAIVRTDECLSMVLMQSDIFF
jgi:methionyl-tRNA synthetase